MVDIKKPISTVELILGMMGFIKSASIVLSMVLIDWARRRAEKAEDRAALKDTEMEVLKNNVRIDDENREKTPGDIVDEFLVGDKPPS